MKLMNRELFPYAFAFYMVDLNSDLMEAVERKAMYFTSSEISIEDNDDEFNRIIKFEGDNNVRVQGIFLTEIQYVICYFKEFGIDAFAKWMACKPDVEKIAEKAFRKFDAVKNSETYPFDSLAAQTVIADCVRMYFDEIIFNNDNA